MKFINNILFQFKNALREVYSNPKYTYFFLIVGIAFLALLVLIPAYSVPGNSISYQLSVFKTSDFILMIVLAVLIGLTFSFQLYSVRRRNIEKTSQSAITSTVSGASGIFAGVVGTAFCASCLIPLFALFGLGGGAVLFVLNNQSYFLLGAVVLMLISLYLAVRQVNRICNAC